MKNINITSYWRLIAGNSIWICCWFEFHVILNRKDWAHHGCSLVSPLFPISHHLNLNRFRWTLRLSRLSSTIYSNENLTVAQQILFDPHWTQLSRLTSSEWWLQSWLPHWSAIWWTPKGPALSYLIETRYRRGGFWGRAHNSLIRYMSLSIHSDDRNLQCSGHISCNDSFFGEWKIDIDGSNSEWPGYSVAQPILVTKWTNLLDPGGWFAHM